MPSWTPREQDRASSLGIAAVVAVVVSAVAWLLPSPVIGLIAGGLFVVGDRSSWRP